MIYNLTEKLKFDEDPKLVIKDVELTVHTEAETVLQLLPVIQATWDTEVTKRIEELLLDAKDRKKLKDLHLKIDDYMTVMSTAVALATGNDPEEEPPAGE